MLVVLFLIGLAYLVAHSNRRAKIAASLVVNVSANALSGPADATDENRPCRGCSVFPYLAGSRI